MRNAALIFMVVVAVLITLVVIPYWLITTYGAESDEFMAYCLFAGVVILTIPTRR